MAALRQIPDLSEVDWKTLAAFSTVALIVWGLVKKGLKPILGKVGEWCLAERLAKGDAAIALAETNKDKIEFLEAALLEMGKATKEWPEMVLTLRAATKALERIAEDVGHLDEDLKEVGKQVATHSGMLTDRPWDGLERRTGRRRSLPQRRADETPDTEEGPS